MSLRAIFGSVISKLQSHPWGPEDTERLAEELYEALSDQGPIILNAPIVIHNPTSEPAISVVNTASVENAAGIEISNSQGNKVQLGIGLGSRGVFASNFVYDESYRSDPDAVEEAMGKSGKGGQLIFSPNSNQGSAFSHPGPGAEYSNLKQKEVASGFSYPNAGSGVPDLHSNALDDSTWSPLPGVGEMLGNLGPSSMIEASDLGSHPENTAVVSLLNSTSVFVPTDTNGWMVNRCTVLEVNGDTLTCQRDLIGDSITVAKPYSLQRTPFDGLNLNGVVYSYQDNQTRTATSSTATETQVISPSYDGTTGYSPGNVVYTRWVSNGTNIDEVMYIDLNVDARAWVAN